MKNIFNISALLLILLCSTWSCKAQSNIINITEKCNHVPLTKTNGSLYLKDINNLYAPYIGTWKWTQGNREFILTLIKQTKYHYNRGIQNYYKDRIVGYYAYKENGIELINTSNDNLNNESFMGVLYSLDCYSGLGGDIRDILKNKFYASSLEILSPTQLRFRGKDDTHIRSQKEGQTPLQPQYLGTTFPLDMVLIKQ
ncbi:DUF6705 family protein [Flavobacterium sp.]|jgi:hypothetical protein|uniref:DUF6705 family protein n=1 Tax=Flavobacterium sp. TaxID=239 RepID=UPI0037C02C0B